MAVYGGESSVSDLPRPITAVQIPKSATNNDILNAATTNAMLKSATTNEMCSPAMLKSATTNAMLQLTQTHHVEDDIAILKLLIARGGYFTSPQLVGQVMAHMHQLGGLDKCLNFAKDICSSATSRQTRYCLTGTFLIYLVRRIYQIQAEVPLEFYEQQTQTVYIKLLLGEGLDTSCLWDSVFDCYSGCETCPMETAVSSRTPFHVYSLLLRTCLSSKVLSYISYDIYNYIHSWYMLQDDMNEGTQSSIKMLISQLYTNGINISFFQQDVLKFKMLDVYMHIEKLLQNQPDSLQTLGRNAFRDYVKGPNLIYALKNIGKAYPHCIVPFLTLEDTMESITLERFSNVTN